jgi:membrane protein involved in colicin uptake
MAERLMSRRALATPAATTPVVTAEEQAKIDAATDAEIAKAVEAAKEVEAAKAAANATPDADKAKAIAEAEAAEVAKVSASVAAAKTAAVVDVIGTEAGKTGTPATPKKGKARVEKFEATKPNGTVVIVERNIDTGEQSVTEK